jgi:mannose-6-phosphate isomerase-like protein (cupin superfamily)
METCLSETNNRLSLVTTRLTLIATIFLPLSFVAGFFGMNMEIVPRRLAVPIVLGSALLVPLGMIALFSRKGWLQGTRRGLHGARVWFATSLEDAMSDQIFDAARQVAASQAVRRLPPRGGKRFAGLFRHGSFHLEVYAPRDRDAQQPHDRDEAYVVIQGTATFVSGTQRYAARPGDFCFAAARERHHFEDISQDFFTWALFYGPDGGEVRAASEGARPQSGDPSGP